MMCKMRAYVVEDSALDVSTEYVRKRECWGTRALEQVLFVLLNARGPNVSNYILGPKTCQILP